MVAAFGLGAQEILLLMCCATVPVGAAAIAFVVMRMSRNSARDDADTTMDSDDPSA